MSETQVVEHCIKLLTATSTTPAEVELQELVKNEVDRLVKSLYNKDLFNKRGDAQYDIT